MDGNDKSTFGERCVLDLSSWNDSDYTPLELPSAVLLIRDDPLPTSKLHDLLRQLGLPHLKTVSCLGRFDTFCEDAVDEYIEKRGAIEITTTAHGSESHRDVIEFLCITLALDFDQFAIRVVADSTDILEKLLSGEIRS